MADLLEAHLHYYQLLRRSFGWSYTRHVAGLSGSTISTFGIQIPTRRRKEMWEKAICSTRITAITVVCEVHLNPIHLFRYCCIYGEVEEIRLYSCLHSCSVVWDSSFIINVQFKNETLIHDRNGRNKRGIWSPTFKGSPIRMGEIP